MLTFYKLNLEFQEFLVVTRAQFNFMLILFEFFKKKKITTFLYIIYSLLISIYQLVWVNKFKFHWIIAIEINH
jgi:hypothetical protein